jgi:hypothetical protein|tara:strand:+ start:17 stop:622 length:606 start_codon:yes stop_codon:yes gene_type:complete
MAWEAVSFDNSAEERIELVAKVERRLRMEALLNLESEIFGFKVRQLTGEDCLKLDYADNKIMVGGKPDQSDFAHLIITVKSHSDKRSDKKIAEEVVKYSKSMRFIRDVYTYIDIAFNDLPSPGQSSESSYKANPTVWLNGIVDSVASEYGWSYDDIMKAPIARTLQLFQYILKRKIGDKYAMRNPMTQKASMEELVKTQNG